MDNNRHIICNTLRSYYFYYIHNNKIKMERKSYTNRSRRSCLNGRRRQSSREYFTSTNNRLNYMIIYLHNYKKIFISSEIISLTLLSPKKWGPPSLTHLPIPQYSQQNNFLIFCCLDLCLS